MRGWIKEGWSKGRAGKKAGVGGRKGGVKEGLDQGRVE